MRISNSADLRRFKKSNADLQGGSGMSFWATQQIETAIQAGQVKAAKKLGGRGKSKAPAKAKVVSGESPGEASVRMALFAAFGDWFKGGEVVPELRPFQARKFRADFAVVRFRLSIEIDGWCFHGRMLEDHESDRERGLFFSSHDWLAFRVSHGQAINNPGMLIDAIDAAMKLRQPVPREDIVLSPIEHKHGVWYQLEGPR